MDSDIVNTLIGASATIIGALIGLIALRTPRQDGAPRPRRKWGQLRMPSRTTMVVALSTVVVVALGFLIVRVLDATDGCRQFVPLVVTSSTEKDEFLTELAAQYAEDGEPHEGVCAQVTVSAVSSGDAMEGLTGGWGGTDYTKGRPEPQVWTPTSSMWVRLYEERLGKTAPFTSITRSPVVIALPKTIAAALGGPTKSLSWNDLRDLAMSPQPWERNPGLPKDRPFTIGKDNPKYSTSGLAATVAAYYAGARQLKGSGDLASAVGDGEVTNYVRSLESGVKYTHDVMDLLYDLGRRDAAGDPLNYLSGIVMQEELVYLYNSRDREVFRNEVPASLREPLHVFYPSDGLLDLDHPYVVLATHPPTVAAAESFRRYLVAEAQQQKFMARGFRHVVHNELAPQARTVMNIPSGPLPASHEIPQARPLAEILNSIDSLRRKARVLLVLDVSGSMNDRNSEKSKLELVKDAVTAALGQLNPYDEVGLMVFSSTEQQTGGKPYRMLVDVGPLTRNRSELVSVLQTEVKAAGNTALYETVRAAVDRMAAPREPDWVNAVVVLSDGKDTESADEPAALAALRADLKGRELRVPVYTIGFGLNNSTGTACDAPSHESADHRDARQALRDISDAAGGACFNAPASGASYINKVFVNVFRHF